VAAHIGFEQPKAPGNIGGLDAIAHPAVLKAQASLRLLFTLFEVVRPNAIRILSCKDGLDNRGCAFPRLLRQRQFAHSLRGLPIGVSADRPRDGVVQRLTVQTGQGNHFSSAGSREACRHGGLIVGNRNRHHGNPEPKRFLGPYSARYVAWIASEARRKQFVLRR